MYLDIEEVEWGPLGREHSFRGCSVLERSAAACSPRIDDSEALILQFESIGILRRLWVQLNHCSNPASPCLRLCERTCQLEESREWDMATTDHIRTCVERRRPTIGSPGKQLC